jgi:hypothetical protein
MNLQELAALLPESIPDSVHELLGLINAESVEALLKARKGTRVQIPKHFTDECWLLAVMSGEELSRLCSAMGGTVVDLPNCISLITLLRDQRLLADKRAGLSIAECALKYGLTERGVSKALRRIEQREYEPWVRQPMTFQQADLFGV